MERSSTTREVRKPVPLPYSESEMSKKGQIELMFDHIAHRYDLLNHLLSANIDKQWRKRAVRMLQRVQPKTILDIATGTGDFAIAAAKLNPEKIWGIDLSEEMLVKGRQKVEKRGLSSLIKLMKADSEAIPFEDNSFDAALAGFGVRNFENLNAGLREICRVLKPGGTLLILEFSRPKNGFIRGIYFFYFTKILPFLGNLVSKDSRAYSYLPESVKAFPDGAAFTSILNEIGFTGEAVYPQTFGIASIYHAQKPIF